MRLCSNIQLWIKLHDYFRKEKKEYGILVTRGLIQQKLMFGLHLTPGLLLKENLMLYDLYWGIETWNIFLKPVSSRFLFKV